MQFSMQFMNSLLNKLVNNLLNKDSKYLVEEFVSENLKLLKQKGDYPYEYITVLKGLMKKNYRLENIFLVQ